jgi:hypothetical protein
LLLLVRVRHLHDRLLLTLHLLLELHGVLFWLHLHLLQLLLLHLLLLHKSSCLSLRGILLLLLASRLQLEACSSPEELLAEFGIHYLPWCEICVKRLVVDERLRVN